MKRKNVKKLRELAKSISASSYRSHDELKFPLALIWSAIKQIDETGNGEDEISVSVAKLPKSLVARCGAFGFEDVALLNELDLIDESK